MNSVTVGFFYYSSFIYAFDLCKSDANSQSYSAQVMLEVPKVRWEDVGGQASVKEQLIEAIQLPQKYPEAFERLGIKPPSGLLMIGPPGCSKPLMARAAASSF